MKELSRKDEFGKFLKNFLDKFDELLPNEKLNDEDKKRKRELRNFFLDGCNKLLK